MKLLVKSGSTIKGSVSRNLTVDHFEFKSSGVFEFSSNDLDDVLVNDFDSNDITYVFEIDLPFGETKRYLVNLNDIDVRV